MICSLITKKIFTRYSLCLCRKFAIDWRQALNDKEYDTPQDPLKVSKLSMLRLRKMIKLLA